jgi:hypothetical protein
VFACIVKWFTDILPRPLRSIYGTTPNHHSNSYLEVWGDMGSIAMRKVQEANSVAWAHGLAEATKSSYKTGADSYEVCMQYLNIEPYDVTEEKLMLFVGMLSSHVAAATSSNYCSAVRSRCIELGFAVVERARMPRLQRLLHGYHTMQKDSKDGATRLAITFSILTDILAKKLQREIEARARGQAASVYSLESFTLSAALYSALFVGLHRPGELTVRHTSKGVLTKPLRRKHFTFRTIGDKVTGATVSIPSTKTDQDGLRSVVEYGLTKHNHLCAVSRLHNMWEGRRLAGELFDDESFLFALKDANGKIRPVEYDDLKKQLSKDLEAAGYNSAVYKSHSFRIGAASTLQSNGVPNSVIEDLGRWVRGSLSIPKYLRSIAPPEMRRRMHVHFAQPYNAPDFDHELPENALIQHL